MITSLPVASGDPMLFALLAGLLLLIGSAFGLAIAGIIAVRGKSEERKELGKKLLLGALIPLVIGVIWWVAVVGLD